MKALTIKQPWAWLITSGLQDIENRPWTTKYRGAIIIHASKEAYGGSNAVAVRTARELCHQHGTAALSQQIPDSFEYGGVVGIATIGDCVDQSTSPWFFGPHGFVLLPPGYQITPKG
jgi:hypothetical protein